MLNQLRVPWSQRILIFLFILIPMITDYLKIGSDDIFWVFYILPAIILSYHYGLKGGVITALFGISIELIFEISEKALHFSEAYDVKDLIIWGMVSLVLLITAIGIGLLADRLRRNQRELKAALYKMKTMAYHDELSNLPNRRKFVDKLSKLLKDNSYQQMIAIMFIDLDRFKVINDTLGHVTGDLLIIEVARQLTICVGENYTVARMGGDEFTVLLDKVSSVNEVETVAKNLIKCFNKPLFIKGCEIHVNLSIGIVVYPHDGLSMEVLLQHADAAMYLAKQSEGNNYRFFSKEFDTKIYRKLEIENQLNNALARSEFTLNYQPQVNLKTRQIIGVEALIRWKNNRLGIVSPAEFIPVAEKTGSIVPIGEWVLTTACLAAKSWYAKSLPKIRVAVNISPIQLIQDQFEEMVRSILNQTGLPPEYLELEITENVGLHGLDKAVTTLRRLREMGIGIAIDDFGTGYSSLSYLVNLPIDTIKIDRVFVQNLNTNQKVMNLAEAIIRISKVMDLHTIAEGIETVEELIALDKLECDQIQGYIFSKPVSPDVIEELLEKNSCGEIYRFLL